MSQVAEQVWRAIAAGGAWAALDGAGRARGLRAIASSLRAARDQVVAIASEESALTPDELAPEFLRMVRTLETFAELLIDGSWVRAAIDRAPAAAADSIGPPHDVRSMLVPLDGSVAVFGASNFPLAYGMCGGDTASALAAGCAVVIKEHPAHLRTGRLLARLAREALAGAGMPGDLLGYVENEDPRDRSVAEALVRHGGIGAVGFTGSRAGGLAIEKLARERSRPIPVFAEMGSMNAVVVLRAALEERAEAIADEIAGSLLARHGQQCTAPGMVIVQGRGGGARLFDLLGERVRAAPARRMLAPWIAETYRSRVREVSGCGAIVDKAGDADAAGGDDRTTRAGVLLADAERLLGTGAETAWEEIFGPAAVITGADDIVPLIGRAAGSLVASLYAGAGDGDAAAVLGILTARCGRTAVNSVPTGVRVCTSMVHGGPFPATNRPDTTAVGPRAIERWCRPACWQNCPDALLPPALRDANPLGIQRTVRGVVGG